MQKLNAIQKLFWASVEAAPRGNCGSGARPVFVMPILEATVLCTVTVATMSWTICGIIWALCLAAWPLRD